LASVDSSSSLSESEKSNEDRNCKVKVFEEIKEELSSEFKTDSAFFTDESDKQWLLRHRMEQAKKQIIKMNPLPLGTI
jgi:hypothetical protein